MTTTSTTTSSKTQHRLSQELATLLQHPISGITASPLTPTNLFLWTASMTGPPTSPYASGTFHLTLTFPPNYPFSPPTILFRTKIYHPNIDSSSGYVGLNILSDEAWTPALTVGAVLVSLRAFMGEPDTEEAVVPEIA